MNLIFPPSIFPPSVFQRSTFPLTAAMFAASCWFVVVTLPSQFAVAQWVHPGVGHSSGSIAFVKAKIEAKEDPWMGDWQRLKKSEHANLNWRPMPRANVERGSYNRPDIGSSEFRDDAMAAYAHALCWALSGEQAHAKKAVQILDAWSVELESIGNHDAALLVGISGFHYCVAAELIKHTWDGWPEKNQERFARMAREIWYPIIKDFYSSANGNWDASMMQTTLAMGVFLEDREMFDRAKNYYLSGKGNGAIGMYLKESGQCQESGRDQNHTQMGLEFLANTCETAWIQGVDLYSALDNRLLAGFEYTAKYNLGNDVPYEPYESFEGRYHYQQISDKGRGRFRPMYQRICNHYHHRQKLDSPYSGQAVGEERSDRRKRTETYIDLLMYTR